MPADALLVDGNRGAEVLREAIDQASIALMAQVRLDVIGSLT